MPALVSVVDMMMALRAVVAATFVFGIVFWFCLFALLRRVEQLEEFKRTHELCCERQKWYDAYHATTVGIKGGADLGESRSDARGTDGAAG